MPRLSPTDTVDVASTRGIWRDELEDAASMVPMPTRKTSDEYYVLDLCDEVLGVQGKRQHRFDWLRGDPSPSRPADTMLPVDGYWESLGLVVEFQEEQHSQPVPFFDTRHTVSGVGRGEQRRRYDERKRRLIERHGLALVAIDKRAFPLRSRRIARDAVHDREVVRRHLPGHDGVRLP